jgi:hypothetical protein
VAYTYDDPTNVPASSKRAWADVMPIRSNRRSRRNRSYGSPGPTVRATMPDTMFDVPDE